jgi:hypothetical protein
MASDRATRIGLPAERAGRGLRAWVRFVIRNRMYTPRYWWLGLKFAWFRLRNPHVVTRGIVFLGRGARVYCRKGLGHLELGRWVWLGDGTQLRCHEGSLRIGDKVVFGGNNVVNAYLDVDIGAETILADWIYISDFDHRFDDPVTPIRLQGIVKSPVRIGRDCWIGEKVSVLRGSEVGEGSVVGAQTVVRGRYPERSIIVGAPGRVIRRRGS